MNSRQMLLPLIGDVVALKSHDRDHVWVVVGIEYGSWISVVMVCIFPFPTFKLPVGHDIFNVMYEILP